MPMIDADGCPIHVQVEGPERAPILMLSNSLGTDLTLWDEQVKPLTQYFRLGACLGNSGFCWREEGESDSRLA
jgi:hypothetical protein